jgi:hypothetical protein
VAVRPRIRLRLSPVTALKAVAFLTLYLIALSLLPSAAAAYRTLTDAERIVMAEAQEPAR